MTNPPSDDPNEPQDDADEALPGHTPADHPGWGSAPHGTTLPPPPPQQPEPSDPFGAPPSYPGAQTPPGYQPPAYPPPPGYQPPPGYAPGYAYGPPAPTTNQKAIWSLVLGILSFCCCLTGIVAIILGVSARQEVKASGGWQTGDGMALAGIITGSIGMALSVLMGIVQFTLS